MHRESLVRKIVLTLCLAAWASAGAGRAFAQLDGLNAIGRVVPLPGQFNELFVDESRGLLYAANFTGGRVEVVSMSTLTRLSSFATTPIPSGTSGMAVSPDGRWMVVTNQPVMSGVCQVSTVTIINLNDPSDRRMVPFDRIPVAVEFGIDNKALVVTRGCEGVASALHLLNPLDGSARTIFSTDLTVTDVDLPVTPPKFTRELSQMNLHASADRRWIFGVGEEVIFSYQIRQPVGMLTIRARETLVNDLKFNQVSAGRDGAYFMAGQLLMTNDLRVIADTAEAPESNPQFIGGTGIDSNIATVYGSFIETTFGTGDSPDSPKFGELLLMDADNLYVRQRFRTAERIVGRIIPAENGRSLYAISDSGILHIALDRLTEQPMIETPFSQRFLLYAFDYCTRKPITQTIRIENPIGGKPAKFSLSTEHFASSSRPGVDFAPHQGVTPADVQITIDPGALGPVQGTNVIEVLMETGGVNIPPAVNLVANIRDVDQRGNFVAEPGHFVAVVGDRNRDRFYVLDRLNFRVIAYDHNMRVIGTFRTGNTPTWMALDRGGNYLVVANSRGENVSLIDLNQMTLRGKVSYSWQLLQQGHYPHSLAASNRNIAMAALTSESGWMLSFLTLPNGAISTFETLGVFTNSFGAPLALAAHPDGDEVLVADASGNTYIYENTSQRLIITRQDFTSLGGAVGAGPDYYVVDNHVLNRSLTPRGDFPDSSANQQSSGFALLPDGRGVRSIRPASQVDSGALQQLDPRNPTIRINSVRMAEPPPARAADYPFTSTLAALRDGRLISTSSAGVVEFPVGYDTGLGNPRIDGITNGADFTTRTAAGGLVSVFGNRLAAGSVGAVDTPLPTQLGGTCVSANGAPLPLLFVSNDQINAQMPFGSIGPVSLQVHTRSGVSDIFVKQVDPAAPAIFGVRGPDSSRYAAVFRENNTLSTLSNPLRGNEVAVIYLTGLGGVTPINIAGEPASKTILARTVAPPTVEIGGVAGEVKFSGLTPGFIGLYQINVLLPSYVPKGLEVPLTVTMGANSTTVNVRIVE